MMHSHSLTREHRTMQNVYLTAEKIENSPTKRPAPRFGDLSRRDLLSAWMNPPNGRMIAVIRVCFQRKGNRGALYRKKAPRFQSIGPSKTFCLNVNPVSIRMFARSGSRGTAPRGGHLRKRLGNWASIQTELVGHSIKNVPEKSERMG